ncbi:MAG TPA: hypothetical protein VGG34_03595 [Opitutaceae bacterium]|jgi:hypothetical protein
MTPPATSPHPWRFFRSGGLDQVHLGSAEDLRSLEQLDRKLWVALSCPVRGLQVDERTLALIDTDKDGHVRPPEVIAAVSWACTRLADPKSLLAGSPSLPLASIGDAALAESARWVLSRLEKPGDSVLPSDAAEVGRGLSKGALKGDGILRPDAGGDDDTRALVADITACCGEASEKTVAAFFSDLEAFRGWAARGGPAAAADLGPLAAEAFEAVAAVKAKVLDYFARTGLSAFDPAATAGLGRTPDDYRAMGGAVLSPDAPAIAALPLAAVAPGKPLPLSAGVNPAWAGALSRLRTAAVAPILGADRQELTRQDWDALQAKLQPYEAWVGTRPATRAAGLGAERIEAILEGGGRKALADLFAEDSQLAPRVGAAADVERLALLHRDLGTILRNFVNFADFYSKGHSAVFQAGTLYVDSRACSLCVQVDDAAAHAAFAVMSRLYVAYLDCRRPGGRTMKIAAAVTQGDSDYLFVGRNGVFYDRTGADWDATITSISDSPISIRQAFLAPYKRASAFISEQFAKFAASKDKAVQSAVGASVASPGAAAAPGQYFDIAKFAGIFAAVGIAIGAVGVAVERIFSRLMGLPIWMWPVAVLAALLIVSGPSILLAAIKLRQRTLGPLLEGTGWAVNGRVKINMPLGSALTERACLPAGSARIGTDPYEDKAAGRRRRAAAAVIVLVCAWLAAARIFRLWPF